MSSAAPVRRSARLLRAPPPAPVSSPARAPKKGNKKNGAKSARTPAPPPLPQQQSFDVEAAVDSVLRQGLAFVQTCAEAEKDAIIMALGARLQQVSTEAEALKINDEWLRGRLARISSDSTRSEEMVAASAAPSALALAESTPAATPRRSFFGRLSSLLPGSSRKRPAPEASPPAAPAPPSPSPPLPAASPSAAAPSPPPQSAPAAPAAPAAAKTASSSPPPAKKAKLTPAPPSTTMPPPAITPRRRPIKAVRSAMTERRAQLEREKDSVFRMTRAPPAPRLPNANERLLRLQHAFQVKAQYHALLADPEMAEMGFRPTVRVNADRLRVIPHRRPEDPMGTFRVPDIDSDNEMEVDAEDHSLLSSFFSPDHSKPAKNMTTTNTNTNTNTTHDETIHMPAKTMKSFAPSVTQQTAHAEQPAEHFTQSVFEQPTVAPISSTYNQPTGQRQTSEMQKNTSATQFGFPAVENSGQRQMSETQTNTSINPFAFSVAGHSGQSAYQQSTMAQVPTSMAAQVPISTVNLLTGPPNPSAITYNQLVAQRAPCESEANAAANKFGFPDIGPRKPEHELSATGKAAATTRFNMMLQHYKKTGQTIGYTPDWYQ